MQKNRYFETHAYNPINEHTACKQTHTFEHVHTHTFELIYTHVCLATLKCMNLEGKN